MGRPAPQERQNRSRPGKALALTTLAVVALAGAGAVWYYATSSAKAAADVRTTDLVQAAKESFEIATTASGELEAKNRVELRSRLERESLITFIIPEGTRAKKGELLVQLNADAIQREVNEEVAKVESAKADLVAAENNYTIQVNENDSKLRQAQLKVDLAALSLAQWLEGEVAMKRQENSLAIERSGLDVDRIADKYLQSQDLFAQGFLSKDEMDRDELTYIEAISKWNTSRLAADVYESYQFPKDERTKQSDVDEARAELERVKLNNNSQLASKEADRKNRQQQLALREQNLAKLREQLESATIKAPQDGLVVYSTSIERMSWRGNDSPLQIGQQVYPNQLIIVLPDTTEMVASVRVPEAIAGRIKPGQVASVKVDAAGGKSFLGEVDTIGILAEGGGWRDPNLREYTVKIALDIEGEADALKPAMRAEARIVLGKAEDVLTIPVQGIFQDGAVRFVHRERADGRYERVPVKMGRRSETRAEVAAGLTAGDRVLIRAPGAGEVVSEAWDQGELKLAGYKLGENGQPMADGPQGDGPGGRPMVAGANRGNRGNGKGRPDGKGGPGMTPAAAKGPSAPAKEASGEAKPETASAPAEKPAAPATANSDAKPTSEAATAPASEPAKESSATTGSASKS